jgi:predicted nucleic acid-binding protein
VTVLADTSVWVDHLRKGNEDLTRLLESGEIVCHPHVIGELACGNLRRRTAILAWLQALPAAPEATHEEVLALVAAHSLHGRGLGWIDAHLLASASLMPCHLWTLDRSLRAAANDLGLGSRI